MTIQALARPEQHQDFPFDCTPHRYLEKNHSIAFSLRSSSVSLIALCPLALSRFGTLAEFVTVAEYSFGSLADC